MKSFWGFVAGLVFGAGLHISGMSNPAKVLNFLDIAGQWDASLLFVMGSAVGVTALGYHFIWRRGKPVFDTQFHIPPSVAIDRPLITGAVLFGLGWGLVGICPGPALSAILLGHWEIIVFAMSMVAGMWSAPQARKIMGLAAA